MTPARAHRTTLARTAATLVVLAFAGVFGAGVVSGAPGEQIGTAAGSGSGGFAGDGGAATASLLTSPSDVAALPGGGYLIADTSNHRVRRVDAAGTIATVAGSGPCCGDGGAFGGDGTPATGADVRLNQPRGVAVLPGGGFLIADTGNNRIRRVSAGGVITTVAGVGTAGFAGDGGPASSAQLQLPGGVAALPDGGFLIADTGNNRIRRVSAGGVITTVAGTSFAGPGGEGLPATQSALDAPQRVAALAGGGFVIADTGNHRIRRVDADQTIHTVAGTGAPGFGGDGGPATAAALNEPEGLAPLADGSIAIADAGNERVRLVGPDGRIRTLAGTGTLGFSGDGGDPELAQLSRPRAVAGSAARMWIADAFNHRVRVVAQPPPPPDDALEPAPPPGVSPPILGRSAVVRPRAGRVLVRLPGQRRFVTLTAIANVPLGSELDVSAGSVAVFFTTDAHGRQAKAIASSGRTILRQSRGRGHRPGDLVLSGSLRRCAASPRRQVRGQRSGARDRAGAEASRAQASRRRRRPARRARHGRRLQVRARGRIRTRGRYGAATVRGTQWMTVDRCPTHPRAGTLVIVSEGAVAVRSFALRRTVLVRRGRRFLAPARRR